MNNNNKISKGGKAKKTLSRLSRCHTYEVSGFTQLGKFCCLTGQQIFGSYPRVYRHLRSFCHITEETEIVNKKHKPLRIVDV